MDLSIKRLDHLGIVAGIMKELNLEQLVKDALKADKQNDVTPGEAVMAMILNGLGFVSRPTTLTPQFFSTKPMDKLIREGISEEKFNRHKLGRVLDAIYEYGCEKFFNEIAIKICKLEKIDLRQVHNDTTSCEVSGDYKNQDEAGTVKLTHGYSKANRPDLKQIVLELCVTSDGGVPFVMRPWSGNKSDNEIFKERVKALHQASIASNTGITLIADAKLYTSDNIKELGTMHFITRVPSTIKLVKTYTDFAVTNKDWIVINENYKYQSFDVKHYGTQQRWIVFCSSAAHKRANETSEKSMLKLEAQLKKDLRNLQKVHFACVDDAKAAIIDISKKYKYHIISHDATKAIKKHATAGRPSAGAETSIVYYTITASYVIVQKIVDQNIDQKSCFALATNIPTEELAAEGVLRAYKEQDFVEKGFAFLKTPKFFADAFYLKSVHRIQATLVIMTLALFIYTIAQRRMRQCLANSNTMIPNQINKPTKRPTLRWLFQCLEGIDVVKMSSSKGVIRIIINGITSLRKTILSCFGETVMKIYCINQDKLCAV